MSPWYDPVAHIRNRAGAIIYGASRWYSSSKYYPTSTTGRGITGRGKSGGKSEKTEKKPEQPQQPELPKQQPKPSFFASQQRLFQQVQYGVPSEFLKTPVYSEGKLTGYYDPIRQMSIPNRSQKTDESEPDIHISPAPTTAAFTIYYGAQRKPQEYYGILALTPEEAKKYKGTQPYWEIMSNNPLEASEEAIFALVPQRRAPIATASLFKENWAVIEAAREQYRQYISIKKEFQTNPEKFLGQQGVKVENYFPELRKQEEQLRKDYEQTLKSYRELGLVKGDIVYDESAFNILQQKYTAYYEFLGQHPQIQQPAQFTLTEEFWEPKMETAIEIGKQKAKERFVALPFVEKAKLQTGGFFTGTSQALLGIGEFSLTYLGQSGVQTINKVELLPSKQVFFGGEAGKIMEAPKGTAEYAGIVTGIGATLGLGATSTIKTVSQSGWKEGLTSIVAGFSPMRPAPSFYMPKISKMEYGIFSWKKGGLEHGYIFGAEKGKPAFSLKQIYSDKALLDRTLGTIRSESIYIMDTKSGIIKAMQTRQLNPFIEVTPSGRVKLGYTQQFFEYTRPAGIAKTMTSPKYFRFSPELKTYVGREFEGVFGTKSDLFGVRRPDVIFRYDAGEAKLLFQAPKPFQIRTLGMAQQKGIFTFGFGGKRVPVYSLERPEGWSFVYSPKQFRAEPTARFFKVNLNQLAENIGVFYRQRLITSKMGGGLSWTQQRNILTYGQPQTQIQPQQILEQTERAIVPKVMSVQAPKITKSTYMQMLISPQSLKTEALEKTFQPFLQKQLFFGKQLAKQRLTLFQIPRTRVSSAQIQKSLQKTILKQTQIQPPKFIEGIVPIMPFQTMPAPLPVPPPFFPLLPILPKSINLTAGFQKEMLKPQRFKYQPSLRALFEGIKGTKPKGIRGTKIFTGFELRPIPIQKSKYKRKYKRK